MNITIDPAHLIHYVVHYIQSQFKQAKLFCFDIIVIQLLVHGSTFSEHFIMFVCLEDYQLIELLKNCSFLLTDSTKRLEIVDICYVNFFLPLSDEIAHKIKRITAPMLFGHRLTLTWAIFSETK